MLRLALIVLTAAAAAVAQQDRIPVDNEWIRVVRTQSAPGYQSKPHRHEVNRVMIHLDAGQMRLAYTGGAVKDLNWEAGQVRWDPAGGEHTSRNTGPSPFRIVEVELKKPGGGAVRWPPQDPIQVDPKHYTVLLDNPQVRVVRARYGPRDNGPMHQHSLRRVTVNLTDQEVELTLPGGEKRQLLRKAGEVVWTTEPGSHSEINLRNEPFEVILVEVKGG